MGGMSDSRILRDATRRRLLLGRIARLPGLAILCLSTAGAAAQELAPRAYWPSPVGTNVLALAYQRSDGDIVVDQSLPVTGVDSTIDYGSITLQHTLDLGGRTANLSLTQAFADGDTRGVFEEEPFTRRTVGALDTVARLAINLKGAPAMDGPAFAALRQNPETIVGASLTVSAPTGAYDPDRVINLGSNRWAVKPALGVIYPITPNLLLETEIAVWLFQDNDDFLGVTREQDPVGALQVHLIKRFRPGFWAAIDANFYAGGRTRIDGQKNADLQRNSRFGATLVYPFGRGQALKFSASTGTVTANGGDYELFTLAWVRAF